MHMKQVNNSSPTRRRAHAGYLLERLRGGEPVVYEAAEALNTALFRLGGEGYEKALGLAQLGKKAGRAAVEAFAEDDLHPQMHRVLDLVHRSRVTGAKATSATTREQFRKTGYALREMLNGISTEFDVDPNAAFYSWELAREELMTVEDDRTMEILARPHISVVVRQVKVDGEYLPPAVSAYFEYGTYNNGTYQAIHFDSDVLHDGVRYYFDSAPDELLRNYEEFMQGAEAIITRL